VNEKALKKSVLNINGSFPTIIEEEAVPFNRQYYSYYDCLDTSAVPLKLNPSPPLIILIPNLKFLGSTKAILA